MWQDDNEESFDDKPEGFILCAIHQAKILRERWKYWSGSVPSHVSIHLHRLESLLTYHEEVQQYNENQDKEEASTIHDNINDSLDLSEVPLQSLFKLHTSQPFLVENKNSSAIEKYFNERIEPKRNIIIEGPDIQHLIKEKRRFHFWCCH